MTSNQKSYGDELSVEEIQGLDTGDLVHVMMCNFDPNYGASHSCMQNGNYTIALNEMSKRLPVVTEGR